VLRAVARNSQFGSQLKQSARLEFPDHIGGDVRFA